MKMLITTATHNTTCIKDLREQIAETRTTLIDGHVFDKTTGEWYGTYIKTPSSLEPIPEKPGTPKNVKEFWTVSGDGSPLQIEIIPPASKSPAQIVELVPKQPTNMTEKASRAGRKPQIIDNPFAYALCMLRFEERPTPWLDDITFGAINTGPGLVNGRHSVSLVDVKKLLRMPELSVASAAETLLNHDRQPMGTRQIQRVIEAARTALRGVALHLERHPDILRSIEMTIDFDKFWANGDAPPQLIRTKEHPKKQLALKMVIAGVAIKTTANKLGISKNTVKDWIKEVHAPELMVEGGPVIFD